MSEASLKDAPMGFKKHSTLRGVFVPKTASTTYEEGTQGGLTQATLLPRVTPAGGVEGDKNPFGKIVKGKIITAQGDQEVNLGEFTPVYVAPDGSTRLAADLSADGAEPAPASKRKRGRPAKAEKAPEAEPRKPRKASVSSGIVPAEPLTSMIPAVPPPAPVSTSLRVQMKGAFGSYKGTYQHIQVTDKLVVLVYDLSAQVFCPPASEEPFDLICEEAAYVVAYVGIDFDLPHLNCGVQVFLRVEMPAADAVTR